MSRGPKNIDLHTHIQCDNLRVIKEGIEIIYNVFSNKSKNNKNIESLKSSLVYNILKEFQKHMDNDGNFKSVHWDMIFELLAKKGILRQNQKPILKRTITALASKVKLLNHQDGPNYKLTDIGHLTCLAWQEEFENNKHENNELLDIKPNQEELQNKKIEKETLKEILNKLHIEDLRYLCDFFKVSKSNKKYVMKNRIIKSGNKFSEIIIIAGYVLLINYIEEKFNKDFYSDMLAKDGLPHSGNKHTLALRVIENDLISPNELLNKLSLEYLRDLYYYRYGKISMKSKYDIISKILLSFGLVDIKQVNNKNKYIDELDGIPPIGSYAFVLMPFTEELTKIYGEIIKPLIEEQNYKCKRADDFFNTNKIMDDIEKAINDAAIIIADLTGKNPNVFYEVGMAHKIKKKVILLAQSVDDIPFDLRQWRYIQYDSSNKGLKKLNKKLEKTIKTILKS